LIELSSYETILFVELKDSISKNDFTMIKKYYKNRPEKLIIISFDPKALDMVLKVRESDDFFKKIKTILLKKRGSKAEISRFDGLDTKYIRTSRLRTFKAQKKIVGVYTKDSSRKIKKYLKKGADFITTNEAKKCERIIQESFL